MAETLRDEVRQAHIDVDAAGKPKSRTAPDGPGLSLNVVRQRRSRLCGGGIRHRRRTGVG
jgi:hypothetical protein